MTYAYDGYTTNLPLEEALKDDVLLVHTAEGGRCRRTRRAGPDHHAAALCLEGAKWIHRIEILTATASVTGMRGYSNSAHRGKTTDIHERT